MIGKVIRNCNSKTITVEVEARKVNLKYGKSFRIQKKYHAHIDDNESVSIGDRVQIKSSRPISKTKKWVFVRKVGLL